MKVLGIDPSSTCTGYAVMTGVRAIVEAGLLRPDRTRDRPIDRILAMLGSLGELLVAHVPDTVLIEVSTGRVGRGRRAGAGHGLVVYGMAVGHVHERCRAWSALRWPNGGSANVLPIEADAWTAGRPKGARIRRLAAEFPTHRRALLESDSGGDAADAIAMTQWWFGRRRGRLPGPAEG